MLNLKKLLGTTAWGTALAIAALIGIAGTAQAKTYGGVFTPPFGGAFPDLEWSGSGTFFIPDACESQPTGWYANAGATCGGMTITNGTLRLESIGNPSVFEVFNFTLPTVNAMYVDGGQLKGVDSEFIGQFQSANFSSVLGEPVWFWLKFEHEIASGDNRSIVQLYFNKVGEGSTCLILQNCEVWGQSETKAILVLVPEPSTYALMVAGLVALGAVARRRRER